MFPVNMDTIFTLGSGHEGKARVNIDELYENEKTRALAVLSMFNRVLKRVHGRIKHISRTQRGVTHCWYVVPEVIIGYPNYNNLQCTAYLIHELQNNGFVVKLYTPNLLFICWKNWTPSYVRDEIRKKTGISIDPFGRVRKQEIAPSVQSKPPKRVTFKDIGSYKPAGKLV